MEIPEDRKRQLRTMRHYGERFYQWAPEYRQCVASGEHFDTLIGYVDQRAPVLIDRTAEETAHQAEANRQKLAPSFRDYSQRRMRLWEGTVGSEKAKGVRQQVAKHIYSQPWVDEPVNLLTTETLQTWVNGVKLEPQSWTALRQWVTNAFEEAMDDGLTKNPLSKVKFPKGSTAPRRKPRPSWEHLRTIMEDAGLRWRNVYVILASTLMRPSSFTLIRIERDIHFDTKKLDVRHSKNGEPYEVDILPWMVEPLKELIGGRTEGWLTFNEKTGEPYAKRYKYGIKDAFEKYEWDKLPGYSLYGLKRAGADALMDGDFGAPVSIETISYLMSHADISTTQIYVGANGRRAHKELAQLTGWTTATTSVESFLTEPYGAGEEIRTLGLDLGKVALYH